MKFPEGAENSVKQIWQIVAGNHDEPNTLYCGVEPAALFRSDDGGDNWSLVQGLYDHPRQSGRDRRDAAFQGYGRMMADAEGRYRFRTLKPVAYPGRTPHIHLKAATGDGRLLTSQFYLAGDPQNERDGVFRAAVRDPRQRELIEMRLAPAPGVEAGAFASEMDIVIA